MSLFVLAQTLTKTRNGEMTPREMCDDAISPASPSDSWKGAASHFPFIIPLCCTGNAMIYDTKLSRSQAANNGGRRGKEQPFKVRNFAER